MNEQFIGQYVLYLCLRSVDGDCFRSPVSWSPNLENLRVLSNWLLEDYYQNSNLGIPVIVDYTGLVSRPHGDYNHVIVPGDLTSLYF